MPPQRVQRARSPLRCDARAAAASKVRGHGLGQRLSMQAAARHRAALAMLGDLLCGVAGREGGLVHKERVYFEATQAGLR